MWKNTASQPVLSNRGNNDIESKFGNTNEMVKQIQQQSIPILPKVGATISLSHRSNRSNKSSDGFVP